MKGGRIILIRRFVPYRMYTFVSERRSIAGYVCGRAKVSKAAIRHAQFISLLTLKIGQIIFCHY